MQYTAIEWTDVTWNPVSGCARVSEGCKFCYAHGIAQRLAGQRAFPNGFDLTLRPHKLSEPRRLRRPSRVFVNSMSDLFWEAIPDDYREQIVDVMREVGRHHYQVLTKRPRRMLEWSRRLEFPPQMWCGVSVENQRNAWRVDVLREVRCAVRFLSVEPLIGPLDLRGRLDGIDWVIVGGESGLHLRSPRWQRARGLAEYRDGRWQPRAEALDWVRAIRDACAEAGVAFFLKQWGGVRPKSAGAELDGRIHKSFPRPHPAELSSSAA